MTIWKKLLFEAESDPKNTANSLEEGLLDDQTTLKDKLFVETGEDVSDIFAAFAHYKLNDALTPDDRKFFAQTI